MEMGGGGCMGGWRWVDGDGWMEMDGWMGMGAVPAADSPPLSSSRGWRTPLSCSSSQTIPGGSRSLATYLFRSADYCRGSRYVPFPGSRSLADYSRE